MEQRLGLVSYLTGPQILTLLMAFHVSHLKCCSRHPVINLTADAPMATRHIILVRHGQSDYRNPIDNNRVLTALGRKQAAFTANRLYDLRIPFDKLVCSSMVRAQETGAIISQHNPNIPVVENCPLIVEGLPCVPSPYEYWNEARSVRLHTVFIN